MQKQYNENNEGNEGNEELKVKVQVHAHAQKGTASEITSAELYKEDPLDIDEINRILLENRSE